MNIPLERLEEISLNASPFIQQIIYDGWLLRFSEGQSKRANGVSVIAPSSLPLESKIKECEAWYAAKNLPSVFRVTSMTKDKTLDATLVQLGYEISEHVDTLWMPLTHTMSDHTSKVVVLTLDEWTQQLYSLRAESGEESAEGADVNTQRDIHMRRIQPVAGNVTCYALFPDGSDTAVVCAQTIREAQYTGIFNVFTKESHRGSGLARSLMSSVLERENRAEVQTAYLQVTRQNTAARRLYDALGFTFAYEYWYRVKAH
jgi:N-acetylglutamate synthase